MVQPLGYLKETASQTAGPYVHIGLVPRQAGFEVFKNNFGEAMLGPKTKGERIIVEGQVIDGAGAPLRDALIEIWQANAAGRYNHPADRQNKPIDEDFRGWGRAGCDFESGRYRFRTIKPGAVVGRSGYRPMAPHVNLWIVARGINIGLSTRMYFSDEEVANATDPVLNIIEPPSRRKTLIGQRQMRDQDVLYSFDIHLQGEQETVFFDV
jgi:protocatechuate 3,4-dioxygenase alpha subunit